MHSVQQNSLATHLRAEAQPYAPAGVRTPNHTHAGRAVDFKADIIEGHHGQSRRRNSVTSQRSDTPPSEGAGLTTGGNSPQNYSFDLPPPPSFVSSTLSLGGGGGGNHESTQWYQDYLSYVNDGSRGARFGFSAPSQPPPPPPPPPSHLLQARGSWTSTQLPDPDLEVWSKHKQGPPTSRGTRLPATLHGGCAMATVQQGCRVCGSQLHAFFNCSELTRHPRLGVWFVSMSDAELHEVKLRSVGNEEEAWSRVTVCRLLMAYCRARGLDSEEIFFAEAASGQRLDPRDDTLINQVGTGSGRHATNFCVRPGSCIAIYENRSRLPTGGNLLDFEFEHRSDLPLVEAKLHEMRRRVTDQYRDYHASRQFPLPTLLHVPVAYMSQPAKVWSVDPAPSRIPSPEPIGAPEREESTTLDPIRGSGGGVEDKEAKKTAPVLVRRQLFSTSACTSVQRREEEVKLNGPVGSVALVEKKRRQRHNGPSSVERPIAPLNIQHESPSPKCVVQATKAKVQSLVNTPLPLQPRRPKEEGSRQQVPPRPKTNGNPIKIQQPKAAKVEHRKGVAKTRLDSSVRRKTHKQTGNDSDEDRLLEEFNVKAEAKQRKVKGCQSKENAGGISVLKRMDAIIAAGRSRYLWQQHQSELEALLNQSHRTAVDHPPDSPGQELALDALTYHWLLQKAREVKNTERAHAYVTFLQETVHELWNGPFDLHHVLLGRVLHAMMAKCDSAMVQKTCPQQNSCHACDEQVGSSTRDNLLNLSLANLQHQQATWPKGQGVRAIALAAWLVLGLTEPHRVYQELAAYVASPPEAVTTARSDRDATTEKHPRPERFAEPLVEGRWCRIIGRIAIDWRDELTRWEAMEELAVGSASKAEYCKDETLLVGMEPDKGDTSSEESDLWEEEYAGGKDQWSHLLGSCPRYLDVEVCDAQSFNHNDTTSSNC